jgi:putative addiction module component (TIGR02574 family)
MPMTVEELLAQSLSLPAPERARVAREIIASLDDETDADAAERWLDEIRRRAAELDAGSAEAVEWEQLRTRLVELTSKR